MNIFKKAFKSFVRSLSNERGDFGKSQKKAEQGITEAGQRVYQAGAQTGEEAAQYKKSFDLGSLIEQLLKYQLGMGNAPSGYIAPEEQYMRQAGPLGQLLYNQTFAEARDPYAYYQSTLEPNLQLAEDYINRQAQGRGLLRSGIPIEQMGRAGVELAIQDAQARMAARSDALQRAAALTEYTQGYGTQNLANLANLYGQQQQFGLQSLGRQAGSGKAAGSYWSYPGQASLGDVYGRKQALYELPGKLIGAAGQAATMGFAK